MGAVIAAAAISAGTTIYATQQQKKAAAAANQAGGQYIPDLSKVKPYKEVNVWGEASKAVEYNAADGYKLARNIASNSNAAAVTDLEKAMAKVFGKPGDFDRQRDETNRIIENHMAGKLSDSTKSEIARGLLGSGVSSFGGKASDDAYLGYLGLTKEGLQTQGVNEYQSLYSMYRQALPLTTAVEAMRYTTLDPAAMVQLVQQENMNKFNSDMSRAGAQYQMGYNNQMMSIGAARDKAAANAQMIQGVGAAAGTAVGAWQNNRTGYDYNGRNSYGGNGSTTRYGGSAGSVQTMPDGSKAQSYRASPAL